MSSSYSIRSTRGGALTITLGITLVFFIWVQFAQYLGGIESHQFSVSKELSRDMQINLDLTVATACSKLTANVLDSSMDRMLASEVLKFQEVDFEESLAHSETIKLDDYNLRRETLHGVLKRAKRARDYAKRKERKGAGSCRIYGSFPVTKVQGDFHIISKEFFLRSFRQNLGGK